MWNSVEIIKHCQPKFVLWENVKNVLSKNHKHNFDKYLARMDELGYNNYYKVLNAKDFGIPQNRERVYVVSIRKDIDTGFEFPDPIPLRLNVKDILEHNVDDYYYKVCPSMLRALNDNKVKDITNKPYSCTLTTKQARWNNAGMVHQNNSYRYLTPRECFRLMGFDDKDFDKAEPINSITNLYKQAGNSIVVNVLEAIYSSLASGNIEFNDGLDVISLFSGIGAFEKALDRFDK